tara:strand:- start:2560 stop:3093 length:534 start_codon:yes stop_codon:yes gene_type:complete
MANMKDCSKFEVNDQYYTPKSAWEQINHLIPKDKIIWEAFLLGSNQSKSVANLISLNVNVVGNTEWDYFDKCNELEYDLIVSNPPFETKIKQKILKSLVSIDKPFILIMNSMNCFSNYFNETFKNVRQHLQIIYPKGKIHFEKLLENGETELKKGTSFYCVYICYKMNIPSDKLFLD